MAAGRGGRGGARGGRGGGRGRGRGAAAAPQPEAVVDAEGWWVCYRCGARRHDSWARHQANHDYEISRDAARRRRQEQERQAYRHAHHQPKRWNRH